MTQIADAVLERRFRAQRLSGRRSADPLEAIRQLAAIQSQELAGGRLAVRARAPGTTASAVDALLGSGAALVSWFNRGTLHLVAAEDYGWLFAMTVPQLRTANERRLGQEGVSPAQARKGVELIARTLAANGPQTRAEIREVLQRAGIPVEGQALVHVIGAAAIAGLVVRGAVRPRGRHGEQELALVEDWLDRSAPRGDEIDIDAAEAELARRYLAAHGPASDRDLARWAGVTVGRARRGLAAIASELAEDGVDQDGERLVRLKRGPRRAGAPAPTLLGQFEPVLLGWTSREAITGPSAGKVVAGGMIRPFALIGGRAVATWKLGPSGPEITPFTEIAPDDLRALERDAEDVERFLSG